VDEVEHLEAEHGESIMAHPHDEKSMSMPTIDTLPPSSTYVRKAAKSAVNLLNPKNTGSSTSIESRVSLPEKPKALRSGPFANASSPVVSTDVTHADAFKPATPPEHSHAMAAISALSQSNSPAPTEIGSPSRPSRIEKPGSQSSTSSSRGSIHSEKDSQSDLTPQPSANGSDPTISSNQSLSYPPSPASLSNASLRSDSQSTRSFGPFGYDSRRDTSSSSGKSSTAETKRLSLAAVTNAAASAKKWGWNAIQRHGEQKLDARSEGQDGPSRPLVMGRGQPLPPPGVPLPRPDKKTKTAPIPVPKRKPIPPPALPLKQPNSGIESNGVRQGHPLPPPLLPKRRGREEGKDNSDAADDGLLVVAAPDSEPTTPLTDHTPTYMQPWVDDVDETEEEIKPPIPTVAPEATPPRLPKRRQPHRVLSTSPEEDGPNLPSWMAAQEEEARAKSTFVDEDAGL
jgi:hypothetical protein